MAESKFLPFQDADGDLHNDKCKIDDLVVEGKVCPTCTTNEDALVPDWKNETDPYLNERNCKYQIPYKTAETTTGYSSGMSEEDAEDSLNGRIQTAPRIDLVAGNNYENVQGVALGERTAEALREMNQIVGQIWSAVFNLALIQSGFNGVIGVNPVPWIASAAPPANLGIYTKVLNSLYQTRTSATMWELNYVTEKPLPGKRYIVSTNVRTN